MYPSFSYWGFTFISKIVFLWIHYPELLPKLNSPKVVNFSHKIVPPAMGVEGVGQNPESPNGGMLDGGGYLAPALNGTGHSWHHPNSVLFKTIKHGSIASDSSMRAFADRLSDKEIVMIIHYFKSLWPDPIREKHSNLNKEEV